MYKGYWFILYSFYQFKQNKLAFVKVPVLALNMLISVPYYVRFLICYMGIVIATSHYCEGKYYDVMFSPIVVKKNNMGSVL